LIGKEQPTTAEDTKDIILFARVFTPSHKEEKREREGARGSEREQSSSIHIARCA